MKKKNGQKRSDDSEFLNEWVGSKAKIFGLVRLEHLISSLRIKIPNPKQLEGLRARHAAYTVRVPFFWLFVNFDSNFPKSLHRDME